MITPALSLNDKFLHPMKETTYPFARSVAEKLQRHLIQQLSTADRQSPSSLAPEPDVDTLQAIIDAAFWASLRREEGYSPKISLACLPPVPADIPLMFERPLPLAPDDLSRLAPAVERPGIHLGVWRIDGQLCVWGATRTLPAFCFVLEVASPGVLVIKYSQAEGSGKFVNFAVLESDQVKILDRDTVARTDSPAVLKPFMGLDGSSPPAGALAIFAKLAISMRSHERGGSLLIVPAGSQNWRESVVLPIRYSLMPPFMRLANMMRAPASERRSRTWQDRLARAVEGIAGLTAVDGATIITEGYEVMAFGAHIRRREGAPQVEQILLIEPIQGASPRTVHVAQLGGTRHLSAAQFAQDQRDAVAFVASQDNRFTLFAWSSNHNMVNAYRVDPFLL